MPNDFPEITALPDEKILRFLSHVFSANRPSTNYATPNSSTVQNNPQLNFTVSDEVDLFEWTKRAITAPQSLRANQREALQIQGQKMKNAVFLVQALDGGWNSGGKFNAA